ncbi:early nodulin-like protein 1 [Vigna umbellata]|uniref:early nodulin-like protein 1 n=1 Tax=Vigna umbellata TaxID=87088 RepID=UPI001F5E93CC|nr:early nodulin-like protein 1 [Vigna umbellata]
MAMGYANNGFLGLFLFFMSISILFSSPTACTLFEVRWVPNLSEDYTHWAQRNRFQVNDTLLFKYKSWSDSVLVVKKEDYYSCNTNNAMQEMDGGDSMFTFVKSGPFFFISGNAQNCQRGQKLTAIVLAVRHNKLTHSLSPDPRRSRNGPYPLTEHRQAWPPPTGDSLDGCVAVHGVSMASSRSFGLL